MFGAAGCGGSGGAATLGGNVTLDGAPVKGGMVKLVPSDGADKTVRNTIIDNGHYYFASVPAGAVKIAVAASNKASSPNDPAPECFPRSTPTRTSLV